MMLDRNSQKMVYHPVQPPWLQC